MIKRANQKKKKGFSLIELIIVLAVMAIIALIAIPNFTAVRDNSKDKADKQSCETIDRAILMLVADDTVKVTADTVVTFTVATDGTKGTATAEPSAQIDNDEKVAIEDALAEVNKPQGKVTKTVDSSTTKVQATLYKITIKTDGSVKTITE